jgi:hypothetical protein
MVTLHALSDKFPMVVGGGSFGKGHWWMVNWTASFFARLAAPVLAGLANFAKAG